MAFIANVIKKVDVKMQVILEKKARDERRDTMARRIQGFILRKLYIQSISMKIRRSRHFNRVPCEVFKLRRDRDPKLVI